MELLAALSSIWASTAFHLALSIFLHVIGIFTGLWIWYLFPKDPSKHVAQTPKPTLHVQQAGKRNKSESSKSHERNMLLLGESGNIDEANRRSG